MSSHQFKPLAILGAFVVLLANQSSPATAQTAAPGIQGSPSASAARSYVQLGERPSNSPSLARPATTEQKSGWSNVVISRVGGCGLSCRAGHAD